MKGIYVQKKDVKKNRTHVNRIKLTGCNYGRTFNFSCNLLAGCSEI